MEAWSQEALEATVVIKLNGAMMGDADWQEGSWTDTMKPASHVAPLLADEQRTSPAPKYPSSAVLQILSDPSSLPSLMSSDTASLSRSLSLPFLDTLEAEDQEGGNGVNWVDTVIHPHLERESPATDAIAHSAQEVSWPEGQVQRRSAQAAPQPLARALHQRQPVTLPMPMPFLKSLSTPQLLSASPCQTMSAQQIVPIATGNHDETLPAAATGQASPCDGGAPVAMRRCAAPVIPLRRSQLENSERSGSEQEAPMAAEEISETREGRVEHPDITPTASPPSQGWSHSVVVERRKEKKSRTLRHGSAIFLFGASRYKKSKEDIRRSRESHHFVPVSISTSAVCWSCRKPLAHKLTVKCQRCNLICHEGCLEQIEVCSASLLPPSTSLHKSSVGDSSGLASDMGQRRRLNSTGNDLSSDELQPPLNGKSSPSVMLEPQQMAAEHGDEGSRLQPTLPPQSLKRLSVPASYPQHTKSTGLGAAQSDSNLSPSKSGSTDSQGADYDSPAEDVSLSEPTSQTGAASAAGKADSVIHLLPMLRFDGDLRLELDEPEAWVNLVEPSVLGQLPEEEVKRQSMIHELIFLEKNYQIILLIIDQLYIAGLQRELQWSEADVRLFFPSFENIVSVHKTFLGRLRARQAQSVVIVQIGDVFLQQFEGDEAEKMKRAYADFCCHKKQAEAEYKQRLKTDAKFAAFDKKWNENIGNRNLRFDSVMQTITQRITKYRILVDNIFKKTNKSSGDYGLMARACHYVDDVISHVNRELDQQKLKEELGRIYRSFDSKSTLVGRDGTPYGPAEEWKKHNLLDQRTLLFEARQVQIQRSSKEEEKKALSVTLLVMSDVLVLLSNSAGRDKYSWASIDSKRDRAVIHLQDLVLRLKPEMAGAEERSLYLVSQELRTPYELTCETAKERDKLRKEIEAARDHGGNLRASSAMDGDDLADALFLDNYTAHIKRIDDVVAACRLRDDGIRRLCLEKEQLLQQMASCAGMTNYRLHRPPLLDMEEGNLQEGGEELLQSAQEAVRQADKLCCLLTAAALPSEGQGQRRDDGKEEAQRRIPSWPYGELHGQASPEPLPTVHLGVSAQAPARRHETFGGFDNKSEMPALTSTAGRSTSMKNPPRQRRSASPLNGTLSPACQPEQSEAQAVPLDQVSLAVSRTSLSPSTLSGRESGDGSSPSASSSPRLSAVLSDEQATLVPALIQLAHHLNQLTDGLAQHLTAVEALRHKYAAAQHKVAVMEGRDKRLNKHSGQLEELRALQEALARDKCQWQAQRDDERQQLDKLRKQLDADMMKAKREREDVEKQRQAMFAQCEKLVENGLEVKLSSSAPYAQIFHRQQPPPEAAMSSELLLQPLAEAGPLLEQDPRLAHLPPRPLFHQPAHYPPPLSTDGPPLQRLTSPPPLAAVLANGGPRSALAARSPLLLPFNSFSSLPVAPALDTGATPPPSGLCGPAGRQPSQSSLLLPTGPPVLSKHSFSWKGSMESLCDKLRNPREGSALAPADRPDSAAPPRPTLRANSEAKLGIGNLMHLSEKDQALDHPPSTRKKGSAKKRYAF